MKLLFKFLEGFSKENKKLIVIFFVLLAISYPMEAIVVPRLSSSFFMNIKNNASGDFYREYFLYAVIIYLVIYTCYYYISVLDAELIPKFKKYTTDRMYQHILTKYQNEYSIPEIPELLHKMHTIPDSINTMNTMFIKYILPQSIVLIGVSGYLFYVNKKIGLLAVVLFSIYFFIVYTQSNKCKHISKEHERLSEKKESMITDKLQNLFSIYSNGQVNNEIKGNENLSDFFKISSRENIICKNNTERYSSYFNVCIILSLITFSVLLFKQNKISNTLLVSLILIISSMPEYIKSISYAYPIFIDNYNVLQTNMEFINNMVSSDNSQKPPIVITEGSIKINDITFGYPDKPKIYTGFSLEIPPKQKVAFLGKSGRGKSTLIKLITGYYILDSGTITIDNTDISKVDLNDLRSKITYVNQNNVLFNTTILENIKYGNDKSQEYIVNLINRLKINIFTDLNDPVGITGDKLSGGQKQMIHILRAICKQNKIVILDEPTSSIDTENKELIINAIKELSKESTVLIITHDESIIRFVDKKILI